MEEDKGVIQGWQRRRWGINVSGTALTQTCDQHCPGLSCSGLGKQTATARGKTALPFTPPTAGALSLPLHWANASRDTSSSEQLSVWPGKGQEQGKAMPRVEMYWPWSCNWLETDSCVSICSVWCFGGLGQAEQVLQGSGMYRKHWTWEIPVRSVLLRSAPVPSVTLSFPKRESAGPPEGSGSSSLWQGFLDLCWISGFTLLWDDSFKENSCSVSQV